MFPATETLSNNAANPRLNFSVRVGIRAEANGLTIGFEPPPEPNHRSQEAAGRDWKSAGAVSNLGRRRAGEHAARVTVAGSATCADRDQS